MTVEDILLILFFFSAFCAFKSLLVSMENRLEIEVLKNKQLERESRSSYNFAASGYTTKKKRRFELFKSTQSKSVHESSGDSHQKKFFSKRNHLRIVKDESK